jgi:hypothetical protein
VIEGRVWNGAPHPFTIGVAAVPQTAEALTNLASAHGPFSVAGQVGNALAFTGLESVQVADRPAINLGASFTLEAWVNPDSLDKNYDPIVANSNYELYVDNGDRLVLFIGDGANTYRLYWNWGAVPGGAWTHVAASVDAATHLMTLYINGVQVAQQNCGAYAPADRGSVLSIGAETPLGANNSGAWQGIIQQVSLWNVALKGAQIAGNMTAALAGTETGLSVYLPMHDATGATTIADLGPNGVIANVVYAFAGLNNVVVGRIAASYGTATYTFSLSQAKTLAFDGLTDNNAFSVTITGPDGLSITRNISNGDSFDFQARLRSLDRKIRPSRFIHAVDAARAVIRAWRKPSPCPAAHP